MRIVFLIMFPIFLLGSNRVDYTDYVETWFVELLPLCVSVNRIGIPKAANDQQAEWDVSARRLYIETSLF